jgi:hypothetical protein
MEHVQYKGHDIYLAEHPKLFGKYEIYKGDQFVSRALSIQDAKDRINKKKGNFNYEEKIY